MKSFIKEEFKNWVVSSLFVVMAAMALVLWSPAGTHFKDIWNSPGRIETIEADIDEINERLSVIKLGDSRVAAFNP